MRNEVWKLVLRLYWEDYFWDFKLCDKIFFYDDRFDRVGEMEDRLWRVKKLVYIEEVEVIFINNFGDYGGEGNEIWWVKVKILLDLRR